MSDTLSTDQAIFLLDASPAASHPAPDDQVANTAPDGDDGADLGDDLDEISDGADAAPEDDAEGASEGQPDGEDEGDEPAGPAIEAPKFWRADLKLKFAELPREVQELIAETQPEADKLAAKQIQAASEAKKAADQRAADLQAKHSEIESTVEQAAHRFVRKWDGIDWAAWLRQDPQTAAQAQAEFLDDQTAMKSLLFAKQTSEREQEAAYLQEQAQALQARAQHDPIVAELFDAKEGQARRTEVAQYLVQNGVPADRLKLISADEMSLARKAMLFDRAQEAAAQGSRVPSATSRTSSPQGKPASAPMRTTGRPAPSTTPQPVRSAQNRFNAAPTTDNAVDLLNALGAKKKK